MCYKNKIQYRTFQNVSQISEKVIKKTRECYLCGKRKYWNMKRKKLLIGGLSLCLLFASCTTNGSDSSNSEETNISYADICSLLKLPSAGEATFKIEAVNGDESAVRAFRSIYVEEGVDLTLSGWALDAEKKDSYSSVYAVVGENVFRGDINVERPDVQAIYGTPNTLLGFSLTIPGSALKDISTFDLVFVGADQSYSSMPLSLTVASKNGISQKEVAKLFALPMKKNVRTDWYGGFCIDANNKESFDGKNIRLNSEGGFSVAGWALDIDNLEPVSKIYAVVGESVFPFLIVSERADVRAVLGMSKVANVGFSIDLPADIVKEQSTVSFIMVSEDGTHRFSSRQYSIAK